MTTEREQLSPWNVDETARSEIPRTPAGDVLHREAVLHQETQPTQPPPVLAAPGEPTLLGFPAEIPEDPPFEEPPAVEEAVPVDVVDAEQGLVVLRRPDAVAGSLMLVAGAAAGMSLFLPWLQHGSALGLGLVRQGLDAAGAGLGALAGSGVVLPLGVALGGAVLFVLGLLAFRPAPTHRAAGVLALVVSLAVAAGVVVRVADVGWEDVRVDPGILCALAVAGFGVLGALKAMLTVPVLTTGSR